MSRLTQYLTRIFVMEALALTSVVVFLLYLVQSLRMFDLVSAKGQDLLTLAGQAALVMPAVAVIFLYVCVGIGLARALRALQFSRQLLVIHATPRLQALVGAIAIYTGIFTLLVLLLAHLIGPLADQKRLQWSASIAVDLVGRALTPHRFAEVVPGVTMVIGGRQGVGEITDFFADDRRDPNRRQTFFAEKAVIMATDTGYVLQLSNGGIRYIGQGGDFSEVSFQRYDLSLGIFSEGGEAGPPRTSWDMVTEALASGTWSEETVRALIDRTVDGLRVIGLCAVIAAIAMFPTSGRRRLEAPLELIALGLAFLERGLGAVLAPLSPFGGAGGPVALLLIAAVIVARRVTVPIRARPLPVSRRVAA